MPDDDSQDRFRRLRQQIEAQVETGLESLSRLPAYVTKNLVINPNDFRVTHSNSQVSSAPRETQDGAEWQAEESASVEARLDQCRGGRLEDHYYAWDLFLRRSRYSPLVLDEQLPKRPRPSDAEEDMDPDLFSWRDPFEDLLAASSSMPMTRTRDRYNYRAMWSRFSHAEPVDFWLTKLGALRLGEVYFPYREFNYQSPQTMEEWVQSRKEEEEQRKLREKEAVQRVQEIAQAFGFDAKPSSKSGPPVDARDDARLGRDTSGSQQKEPQSEQDLFEFIRSTSKEVIPPLSAFVKLLMNGKWVTESSTSTSTSRTFATSEEANDESLQTTESTEEWVKNGYIHIKKETRKTTADGKEISRETRYSTRPATAEEQRTLGKDGNGEEEGDTKVWTGKDDGSKDPKEKKNSWLWK